MSSIVVRGLEESVKAQLAAQAKQHGRSMEAEVRDILTQAAIVRTLDWHSCGLHSRWVVVTTCPFLKVPVLLGWLTSRDRSRYERRL